MQQIWTFKFPELVRQHILGVVDNVVKFRWKFNILFSSEESLKIG